MSIDAIISLSGITALAVGLVFVLRANGQTIKTAEPDPERVKAFIATAPLDRLESFRTRSSFSRRSGPNSRIDPAPKR